MMEMMELIEKVAALNLQEEDFEKLGIPDPYEFEALIPSFIAPNAKTGEDEIWYWCNEEKEREWLELILKKANAQ